MWGEQKESVEPLRGRVKDSGACSAGCGKEEGDMDKQWPKQNTLVDPWTPENPIYRHWDSQMQTLCVILQFVVAPLKR